VTPSPDYICGDAVIAPSIRWPRTVPGKASRRVARWIVAVAIVVFFGILSRASAYNAPPGAHYCAQLNYRDSVTLYVSARHVSCGYAVRYARGCFTSSSLRGWHYRSGIGRVKLTRGSSVIWFDIAGGGPKCLRGQY
jgi:hypothetical protein